MNLRPPDAPRPAAPGSAFRPLRVVLLFFLAVALAWCADAARADLIFLKDGFVLQGKVTREGKTVADPHSGQGVWMPQGFFWVDDGARRIAFAPGQVQAVEARDLVVEHDIQSPRVSAGQRYLPPLREVISAGSWDDRWDRTVRVRCVVGNSTRDIDITQHLTTLSPHYIRLDALGYGYRWTACYLTKEFPPEMVRALLFAHPEFKEDAKTPPDTIAAKRFRAFHFLVQAGWYDLAEKELDRLLQEQPAQKEKVETARQSLKKLRAAQRVDDLNRAREAGQHDWVVQRLADFNEEGLPDKVIAQVRTLKEKYEKSAEHLKQARRFLEELPKEITDTAQREPFAAAAAAIARELDHDNAERLEPFLGQALQAERQKKQGEKPEQGPAELLALAVSGWLLGGTAAEAKVETALRLWKAREFALAYERQQNGGERQTLLRNYLAQKDAIGVDEMAQLITKLPPAEPEEKIGSRPFKLETRGVGRRQGVTYHVQVPPEYHHGRPHPVLIVLHPAGGVDAARDLLDKWSEAAAQHGYLLVAPEWLRGLASTYNYTAEEHAAVLDVLRDLRRRFNVDSDRVFLHGLNEGGSMAYDVALAHPDLFAGVIPMGGQPERFARRYYRNAQYLPFYVVSGDLSGKSHEENRRQFEDWIPKGYPAIFVERRGRGQEWFAGELPYLFTWMKYKKRTMPMGEVGAPGREFLTMRETDNAFYWLSTDSVHPRSLNDPAKWNPAVLGATLFGHIDREANQITARTNGLQQLSIWLYRDSQGRGIVDFGAAVTVTINGQRRMSGKVTPSMETLLEDFHQRGDRQRLFLARLDFNRL